MIMNGSNQTSSIFWVQRLIIINIFPTKLSHLTTKMIKYGITSTNIPFLNQSSVNISNWSSFFIVVRRIAKKFLNLITSSSSSDSMTTWYVFFNDSVNVSFVRSRNDDNS